MRRTPSWWPWARPCTHSTAPPATAANLEGEPDWQRRRSDGTLPAPPHDATGHTWHHSDEQLFRLTRDGPGAIAGDDYRTTMPAYAGILSDREIWAVLAYIKSRWPEDIRRVQSQR